MVMAKRRFIQAINDAMFEEMERDPRIILFGEDVEISMFGDTKGLRDHFGPDRVRDTPICEALLTGMAVGMAAAGWRPVLHMMFSNFMYTGFDAIANQMSKLHLMTGGQMKLPITVMAGFGGGRSTAAQHSDCPYPLFMNLGGINVAVPSNAGDAKGLFKTAVRSNDPAIFLEPGGRGGELGEVPDGEHLVSFGKAAIRREGRDVTIVAIGAMVKLADQAAKALAANGVEAEIIDPRTLVPLDEETILASIAKTRRLVIVDEARDRCSAASQIAAVAADRGFGLLKAPVKRVTVPNVCMPYAPVLERSVYPSSERIVSTVLVLVSNQEAI
jgi:pyruvate dehydrogenase E1 component beta subunit